MRVNRVDDTSPLTELDDVSIKEYIKRDEKFSPGVYIHKENLLKHIADAKHASEHIGFGWGSDLVVLCIKNEPGIEVTVDGEAEE